MFEFRDPIHHKISFNAFEKKVIDHPFFQRLRFISQLAFLQMVYPGGTHNRFVHSLGVMHVAGRLYDQLFPHDENGYRQIVRIAGLLHDIGHGPFSHATESLFLPVQNLPLAWNWWSEKPTRRAVHEDYSVLLIQTLADEGVFDHDFAQDVASLVHAQVRSATIDAPTHTILKSLISSELDADRMDYLLRDSYYCGVSYGTYDIDWLISSLSVVKRGESLCVAMAENGVRAFESFLLARYHMIDQVYFHKTNAGFVAYLQRAFLEKEIDVTIPTDAYAYARLRDGTLMERLFEAAQNTSHYWSHHLVHRIPAYRVLRLRDDSTVDQKILAELIRTCTKHSIAHFTHSAHSELSSSSHVFVEKKTLRGVLYEPIDEYSDLLQKYRQKICFTDFFIHREAVPRWQALRNVD